MTRASVATRWRIARSVCLPLVILAAACGTPRVTLPSGAGTPFPDAIPVYADAVRECRGARTLTASLSLSGRAGASKLSARVDAGFSEPGRLRLEGYPRINFGGKPFFILVANGRDATLVLTRENRVLSGAPPAAIIEALAGIALEPDEMRALIAGCAIDSGEATDGRSFGQGWASVQTGNTTVFLRQIENRSRVAGLRRGSLVVEYSDFTGGQPATVHLHTTTSANVAAADLTIRVSQREVNVPLETAVFSVDVPKDAAPLTLEELRRAGPLGAGETKETESTGQDQHGGAETRRKPGQQWSPDPGTSDAHKVGPSLVTLCASLVPGSSRAQRGATTRFSVSPNLRVESLSRDLRPLRQHA